MCSNEAEHYHSVAELWKLLRSLEFFFSQLVNPHRTGEPYNQSNVIGGQRHECLTGRARAREGGRVTGCWGM